MSVIVRLVYGGRTFDLNDGTRFMVEDGRFTPPGTVTQLNMTGARTMSGGTVLSKQGQDRKWSFEVVALGSSITQTHGAVRQLQEFLSQDMGAQSAGAPSEGASGEQMYLEYCPVANIPYKPAYGQAGWWRYEIKHGQALLREYGAGMGKAVTVLVELTIGPYMLGLEQAAMQAFHGVWEDDLFASQARGVLSLPAVTNLFTNPVFQYAGTGATTDYYNGWTFGTDLSKWQDTRNKESALFGEACLVVKRSTDTSYNITQSITAANTNTHIISCYARRLDGGTIDANVLKIYYNSAEQTTSYVALKDGWYRVWASFAGVASAKDSGVSVKSSGVVLFLTGFQFEQKSNYPSPFVYGDMAGARWSGARHNSTSVNDANGYLYQYNLNMLFNTDNIIQGTIRLAIRWYQSSTYEVDRVLFSWGSGGAIAYYKASDDKIYFYDGANIISTAALTFAAGDIYVLHFVFGPSTAKIYINGVEAASGNIFEAGYATGFYLGINTSGNYPAGVSWLDFTTWQEMASGTQIAADYSDISSHISSGDAYGERLSSLPWYCAEAAAEDTGILSEYINGDELDYIVAGGIGGDAPARTKFLLEDSGGANGRSFLLGHNTHPKPIYIPEEMKDLSGTVNAAALGGEVLQQAVNTTEVFFPASGDMDILNMGGAYYGKTAYAIINAADAGANLKARLRCKIGSAYTIYSDWKPVVADGTLKKFLIGPIVIPDKPVNPWEVLIDGYGFPKIEFAIGFIRTTDGSANVGLDFYRVLVGKVLYADIQSSATGRLGYDSASRAYGFAYTTRYLTEQPITRGDVIEMEPGVYNYLHASVGDLGANLTITWNTIFKRLMVTPRWRLV